MCWSSLSPGQQDGREAATVSLLICGLAPAVVLSIQYYSPYSITSLQTVLLSLDTVNTPFTRKSCASYCSVV